MERKFTTQDMANELGNTVAVMAASAFNLIGAGAYMYVFGVYVDNVKAADVTKTLHDACGVLGYGKSSKYELASAAIDVAKAMVKTFGRPDGSEVNAFWSDVGSADTAGEAIALIIANIKATYNVTTVRDLGMALKGQTSPKTPAEKPVADKVAKALEGASGDELAAIANGMVSLVKPSDAKALMLNLASKLTDDELYDVLEALNNIVLAKGAEQVRLGLEAEAKKAA